MRRSLSLLAFVLLLGCRTETRQLEPSPEPVTVAATVTSGLESCEAKDTWRSRVNLYGWWPRAPQFSPDESVVTHAAAVNLGGVTFLGVSDGRSLAVAYDKRFETDTSWQRRIVEEQGGLAVTEGGAALLTMEDARHAVLTPSGRHVIAMIRFDRTHRLEVFDLDVGTHQVFDAIGFDPVNLFVVDDRRFLVAGYLEVAVVDIEDGVLARRSFSEDRIVVSIAAHGGIGRAAVVTKDGRLHLLELDDLTTIETRPTTVVFVNEDIYAPLIHTSPIAWSADGRLFASLDENGDTVVEGPTGELHRIPPLPLDERRFTERPYLPGAVAFSPSGDRLALGYEGDLAVFGCVDTKRPESVRGLDVEVVMPSTVEARTVGTIEVRTPNYTGFRAAKLLIDGEDARAGTQGELIRWSTPAPGTYEARVVVDTGTTWGEFVTTIVAQ